MKTLNKQLLAAAGLAAAVTVISALSVPTTTAAFSFIGGNLGLTQRDFRVWNNFTDATANNNVTPHANFPGQTGAVMAIWKGESEWASGPVGGNGQGDSLNANIGDGGANFDTTFQGTATSIPANSNVHAELAGGSGSVLAFTITPISDGWTIQYYSSWTWHDGPGSVAGGICLQGVACHEIGHSLGLGHSSVSGTTMFASVSGSGTAQRSIEADDIAGVKAIYGAKSASKPLITGIAGTKQVGSTLTISGSNFSTSGNEVWFTKAQPSDGNPVKVTGVASSGGGTSINVTIPSGIQDGEVLVKNSAGSSHANLSNAFPIDTGAAAGDPPSIDTVNPPQIPSGGFTPITITGSGFTGTTSVKFDGVNALSFNVNSTASITAMVPPGPAFTLVDVTVTDADGTSTLPDAFIYWTNPSPQISSVVPGSGPAAGGTQVTITGPSVVGVSSVTFDGVAGTGLQIQSATQLKVNTPAGATGPADVTATGNGSSTIAGGFTYTGTNPGQFVNIGPGLAGLLGVPVLAGSGDLTPGSASGFTLTGSNIRANSPTTMYFGLTQAAVGFKGGTFYPFPILTQIGFTSSGAGTVVLPAQMPANVASGTVIICQTWTADSFAVQDFSASNGLKLVVP